MLKLSASVLKFSACVLIAIAFMFQTECDEWIQIAISLIYEMSGDHVTFVPTTPAEVKASDATVSSVGSVKVTDESEVKVATPVSGSRTPVVYHDAEKSSMSQSTVRIFLKKLLLPKKLISPSDP